MTRNDDQPRLFRMRKFVMRSAMLFDPATRTSRETIFLVLVSIDDMSLCAYKCTMSNRSRLQYSNRLGDKVGVEELGEIGDLPVLDGERIENLSVEDLAGWNMANLSGQMDEGLVAIDVEAVDLELGPIPDREQMLEHRAKRSNAGDGFRHLAKALGTHQPKARIGMKVFQRVLDMIALPRRIAFPHNTFDFIPRGHSRPPVGMRRRLQRIPADATFQAQVQFWRK